MTRRKRTPSPSSARKQINFEIPASLQHLSTLSKSLAKRTGSSTNADQRKRSSHYVSQQPGLSEPSQAKGESSASDQSTPGEHTSAIVRSLSQSRKKSVVDPDIGVSAGRGQTLQNYHITNSSSFQVSSSANVVPQNYEYEPREGETLSLKKHATQISALRAKKIAENEANRNRERWARAQAEHLAKSGEKTIIHNTTPTSPLFPSQHANGGSFLTSPSLVAYRETTVVKPAREPATEQSSTQMKRVRSDNIYSPSGSINTSFSVPSTSPESSAFEFTTNANGRLPGTDNHSAMRGGLIQLPLPPASQRSHSNAQPSITSTMSVQPNYSPTEPSTNEVISIPPLFSDHAGSRALSSYHQPPKQQGSFQHVVATPGPVAHSDESLTLRERASHYIEKTNFQSYQNQMLGRADTTLPPSKLDTQLWTSIPRTFTSPTLPNHTSRLAIPIQGQSGLPQPQYQYSQHPQSYQTVHQNLRGLNSSANQTHYQNPGLGIIAPPNMYQNIAAGSSGYPGFISASSSEANNHSFANMPPNGFHLPKR